MAALTPSSPPLSLPETCGVAFKEWSGVCAALADGRQSILLRKGGIAEEAGSGAFVPEHRVFWLYPTRVHEARQGLKVPTPPPIVTPPAGWVALKALAMVESVQFVDRLDDLLALDVRHVWTEETIRQRFAYRRPGLWVLTVRVHHRAGLGPHLVEITPEHAGCKTWVPLDPPLSTVGLVPVAAGNPSTECRQIKN